MILLKLIYLSLFSANSNIIFCIFFSSYFFKKMGVAPTQVVEHNGDVVWYWFFGVTVTVVCPPAISYLLIFFFFIIIITSWPSMSKTFKTDMALLCCFMFQGSTIDLKRMYISAYVLKNLCVHHVQGRNYKKVKNTGTIRIHQKQRTKNLFDSRFC